MATQLRVANQVAQQRLIVQLHRAKSFPKQLASANRLLQEGDLRTSCLIYQRLAVSRPPSEYSEEAKAQLRQLQDIARQQLKSVDQQLAATQQSSTENIDQIARLFQQYDELVQKYSAVPVVNRELDRHVRKQRRDPAYAIVLSEAEARRLWVLGQGYEQEGHLCCAHEVYTEASSLVPAETARRATVRLQEIDRGPTLTKAFEECRKLQVCHEKFQLAEISRQVFPDEAEARYRWILENAPHDSRVFIASADRLKKATVAP